MSAVIYTLSLSQVLQDCTSKRLDTAPLSTAGATMALLLSEA